MKYHTRFFAVLFVLLATFTIDAREPWPPKDGLGKDLPKELSAAYWYASDMNPKKFPYPDEVQSGFSTTSTQGQSSGSWWAE